MCREGAGVFFTGKFGGAIAGAAVAAGRGSPFSIAKNGTLSAQI